MMQTGTGFSMIENYNRMLQTLRENGDQAVLCDDQKVPVSLTVSTPETYNTTVKVERDETSHQQDFCALTDMLVHNYEYSSNISEAPFVSDDLKRTFHIPESEYLLSSSRDFSQTSHTSSIPSATTCYSMSSNVSNPVSSQSLQIIPPSSLSQVPISSSPSTLKKSISTKTRTFVTGLAGSGCTVTTNSTNFLFDTNSDYLENCSDGDILEYTDLDKPVSFYDDFEDVKENHYNGKKSSQMQGINECANLEECVQDIIRQESANLHIPFDPQFWTSEHVYRWIQSVFQKNKLCDISKQYITFNGEILCSWNENDFYSNFGSSGPILFNELVHWKAASNYYFPDVKPAIDHIPYHQPMSTLGNDYLGDINSLPISPASSPVHSPYGGSSTDSSNSILSHHLDIAYEETTFYPDVKLAIDSTNSCKPSKNKYGPGRPGRGHKKSIALWQFLRKLLLSEQNCSCIRWIDREAGIFKIEDSKKVANLWGAEKNRPAMNYDKLSRSVRQYYKKGIIKKPEQSKRLLYQFCPEYL